MKTYEKVLYSLIFPILLYAYTVLIMYVGIEIGFETTNFQTEGTLLSASNFKAPIICIKLIRLWEL